MLSQRELLECLDKLKNSNLVTDVCLVTTLENHFKMLNSSMEIIDLIETIAHPDRRKDTFYFVMEDTSARQTEHLVNHSGEIVGSCEVPGTLVTSHFTQVAEDAVGFLFDADIALWELVSWEVSDSWYDSKQWKITLRR